MNTDVPCAARVLRGSSLKRFLLVTSGIEKSRLTPDSMSFADLAFHLIEADQWLLSAGRGERSRSGFGSAVTSLAAKRRIVRRT